MKEETRTLITYRLERAREALQEAVILLERGHGNTFVNCLYYCFQYPAACGGDTAQFPLLGERARVRG